MALATVDGAFGLRYVDRWNKHFTDTHSSSINEPHERDTVIVLGAQMKDLVFQGHAIHLRSRNLNS